MLEHLATEQPNPASAGIDRRDTRSILEIINDQDATVARAVRAEIPRIARAVDRIAEAFRCGGRLFFQGAGTSGRMGVLEATECPPTFNVPAAQIQAIIAGGERALFEAQDMAEDDAAAGAADLRARGFTAADVLVGISASGESVYVVGAVEHARAVGGLTIGICSCRVSSLARAVDIPITPETGPEVVAGSTRLKAATATKLVTNMLTTASMIRVGHVFDNLMVNVQPTNRKLRERARRIITLTTGLEGDAVWQLLENAGGSAKTAILMARLGISRQESERRLAVCGGRVAEVLDGAAR